MRAGSLKGGGREEEDREKERDSQRERRRRKRSVPKIRQIINYVTYARYELIPLRSSTILNREGLNRPGIAELAKNGTDGIERPFVRCR